MIDLCNLDSLDDIQRGVVPKPEATTPSDTTTAARLLADAMPGVVTADTLPPPVSGPVQTKQASQGIGN